MKFWTRQRLIDYVFYIVPTIVIAVVIFMFAFIGAIEWYFSVNV